MGLLEEAIREHLDLQRRRGGDPRQIALAEREALEPLLPGQTPDWAQRPALFDGDSAFAADGVGGAAQLGMSDPPPEASLVQATPVAAPMSADPGVSAGGAELEQETAELDMRTVLSESPAGEDRPALEYAALRGPAAADAVNDPSQPIPEFGGVRARRIVTEPSPATGGEPDFEWEIPGVTRSPRAGA